MHQQEIMTHYRKHYQYQNLDTPTARAKVNSLLPQIQQNDQQAFNTALRIIREKAYFHVCRQVSGGKFDTLDFVDDIMQYASLEYAKKAMGGFGDIGHENFYAYSLKFFSLCATHFISRYHKKVLLREMQLEDGQAEWRGQEDDKAAGDPEQMLCCRLQEDYKQRCIAPVIGRCIKGTKMGMSRGEKNFPLFEFNGRRGKTSGGRILICCKKGILFSFRLWYTIFQQREHIL